MVLRTYAAGPSLTAVEGSLATAELLLQFPGSFLPRRRPYRPELEPLPAARSEGKHV